MRGYAVTEMTVTLPVAEHALGSLTPEQHWSVCLAVAQWLQSARAVVSARERLVALGASDNEIERRRRADSNDAELAALLRLAVTIVITRGRLAERDRRRLMQPSSDAVLRALIEATADAYARVLHAESTGHASPAPRIDMNIGDY